MAYGNKTGGKTLFFTFINLKKEDDKAYIEVFDRAEGEKGEVVSECDYVQGQLIDIKFGTGEYQKSGDVYPTVVLTLKDIETEVRYRLKCKFEKMNGVMRSILNRLLTATSFDNIYIAYFGNKGEYKNASVKSNDIKLEYMYTREELAPMIEKIVDKKGTLIKSDYSDLDEFLISKVKDIIIPQLTGDVSTSVDKDIEPTTSSSKSFTPRIKSSEEAKDNPDPFANIGNEDDLPF
jgi:hypothetical protein